MSVVFDAQGGRSIVLQTAEGGDIPNYQTAEITLHDRHQHSLLDAKYGIGIRERSGATAIYNCHGLVFAARRTAVHHTQAVYDMLRDDRYREVPASDALPGDLILYLNPDSGDVEHSAVVIEPPAASSLGVPLVFSKWGKYKELLHPANNCPYDFSYCKYYRVHR